jgi:GNAT superfamily N-acetyltransferase
MASRIRIEPVTPDRWPDLVDLFERPGPRGAWSRTGACYCMFWRLPPSDYDRSFRERTLKGITGGPNKTRMRKLVAGGAPPGLLAYREELPVGWVAVSPRSQLVRLGHSPGLRSEEAENDERAWSISCFYVHRSAWRTGVGTALLEAAIRRAVDHDASAVEAYPVKAGSIDPYTGYDTMFERVGFRLVRPGRGLGRALWRRP